MAKKSLFNADDFALPEAETPVIPPVEAPAETPAEPAPKPKKEVGKKAMPIYLTEEQHAYLSYKARLQKTTINSLLRELINDDIAANPGIAERSKDFI